MVKIWKERIFKSNQILLIKVENDGVSVHRAGFLVAFSTHRVLIWTKWTNEGAWKNFQSKIWLQTQCIGFLPQLPKGTFCTYIKIVPNYGFQKVCCENISNICQIMVAKLYILQIYQFCAKLCIPSAAQWSGGLRKNTKPLTIPKAAFFFRVLYICMSFM